MRKIIALPLAAAALAGAGGIAYAQAERGPAMARAEVEQRSAERFARMDANDDGVLDQGDRAARRKAAFERIDADKNGAIDFAEFSAQREARAERRGGDGARMGRRGHGGRGLARMADADKDGAITRAEFTGAALARFDRIDANRDGTISAEERAARRPMRRMRDAG